MGSKGAAPGFELQCLALEVILTTRLGSLLNGKLLWREEKPSFKHQPQGQQSSVLSPEWTPTALGWSLESTWIPGGPGHRELQAGGLSSFPPGPGRQSRGSDRCDSAQATCLSFLTCKLEILRPISEAYGEASSEMEHEMHIGAASAQQRPAVRKYLEVSGHIEGPTNGGNLGALSLCQGRVRGSH